MRWSFWFTSNRTLFDFNFWLTMRLNVWFSLQFNVWLSVRFNVWLNVRFNDRLNAWFTFLYFISNKLLILFLLIVLCLINILPFYLSKIILFHIKIIAIILINWNLLLRMIFLILRWFTDLRDFLIMIIFKINTINL